MSADRGKITVNGKDATVWRCSYCSRILIATKSYSVFGFEDRVMVTLNSVGSPVRPDGPYCRTCAETIAEAMAEAMAPVCVTAVV